MQQAVRRAAIATSDARFDPAAPFWTARAAHQLGIAAGAVLGARAGGHPHDPHFARAADAELHQVAGTYRLLYQRHLATAQHRIER